MNAGARSHHDEPALVDGLGRENFIQSVCRIISDCQASKGIAISGYWQRQDQRLAAGANAKTTIN
ncbi:MAG: hypothetical protein ACREV4_08240 [Gammaproteobacteria bacterium]